MGNDARGFRCLHPALNRIAVNKLPSGETEPVVIFPVSLTQQLGFLAEHGLEFDSGAATENGQGERIARDTTVDLALEPRDHHPLGLERRERLAVQREDNVAILESGLLRRTALEHFADHGTGLRFEFQKFRHIPVHRLEAISTEPREGTPGDVLRNAAEVGQNLLREHKCAALLNVDQQHGVAAVASRKLEKALAERGRGNPDEHTVAIEHRQPGTGHFMLRDRRALRQRLDQGDVALHNVGRKIFVFIPQADAPDKFRQRGHRRCTLRGEDRDRGQLRTNRLAGADEVPATERVLTKVFGRRARGLTGQIHLEIFQLPRSRTRIDRTRWNNDRTVVIDDRAHRNRRAALGLRLRDVFHGDDAFDAFGPQRGQIGGGAQRDRREEECGKKQQAERHGFKM